MSVVALPVQYHKEVTRLVTGQHRAEVAPMLVNLARMWMKFVKAHYSHGRGCRPRWANAGLEFIVFVCNPHNTCYLQEQDFQVRGGIRAVLLIVLAIYLSFYEDLDRN